MGKSNKKDFHNIKIGINIFLGIISVLGTVSCIKENINNLNMENIPMILGLIIIVVTFIGHLSVFVHELGHAIYLKIAGYKIKIFKAGPLKYINNAKGRKVFFDKTGLIIIGGYVTPEINSVLKDQESFDKFTKQYIKFIFSGIIVTIFIMITSSILLILNKAVFINLLIVLINWPMLIKSLNNEASNYGDFYVINLLREKPEYVCAVLQNNLMTEYPLNSFLKAKIEKFLNYSINAENYNELVLGLADKIVDEYIIEEKELSFQLEKLKQWIFGSYERDEEEACIPTIVKIKISHKLLLHEYVMKKKDGFQDNYNKLLSYLPKMKLSPYYEFIKIIMNTLKQLYEEGGSVDLDFKFFISDLEFSVSECENYQEKIALIGNRLSH